MNITYAKNKKAFTLIEIIVVVTIIGILSAIALPSVTGYLDTTKKNQVLLLAQNYFDVAKSAVNDIHSGQFKSSSGDPIKFLLQDSNQKVSNVTSAYFVSGEYIAYYPENIIKIIGKDGTLAQLTAGYAPLESYVEQTVSVADTSTFDGQLKCVTNAMSKYILEPSKLKMGGIRVGESIDFDNPITPPDNSSSGSSSAPTGNKGKLKAPLNLRNKSTDTDTLTGGSTVQNILTWDAVPNATSYTVTVTNSANQPTSLNVTGPTADISSLSTATGDYVVSVTAKADNYTDSDSATLKLHKMAEVTNLTAVENNDQTITITWSGDNSKTGKYLLHHKSGALEDTRLVVPTTNASVKTVTINLKDILDTSTNSLRIDVRSLGNASTILSSNYTFVMPPLSTISVVNTATTNPTGTFVGRAYKADIIKLTPGAQYSLKLYPPNSTTAYETINFTPTAEKHTIDLTGKFKPIMDGANGVHKITLYKISPINGEVQVQTTTRDISFYYGNGSYKQNPADAQDGTEDFYAITDPESLQALSLKVANDNANFGTKNYKQIASIDMTSVANFVPIGEYSRTTPTPFKGTYDGGAKADGTGYEIKNLKINKPNYQGVGLFGHTDGATLKNITIGTGSSIIGGTFVGSIAGTLSHSEILNCKNAATVTATGSFAGGIVGRAANYDTNNYRSKISNSANTGNVEGIKYLGGIAGITIRGDIDTSYNTGTVVGTCAGGIVGQLSGNINRCYNTGEIQGKRSGSITEDYMGGIAGLVYTEGEINNSYNTGIISSPAGSWIGGISGAGSGGSTTPIKNVYNKANVTGTDAVGGVLGTGGRSSATNLRYNRGATITGSQESSVKPLNVPYTHISEFVNATGADRSKWDDKGRLLNADGTLMAGPNPGDAGPQVPEDTAKGVTMTIKTTGKNATGTFAGREYQLEVTGLTKGAKYKVTVGGVSKVEFTATGAVQTIDLKGAFAPTVPATTATHTAQVGVTALNPATGVTADKGSVSHNLTFYDGNGSTTAPYLICDPESLQMLSHKVNNDNANFGSKNYKQIVSVDMTPVAKFVPIGEYRADFLGTYDGGAKADGTGYEIKNLNINTTSGDTGLFGLVDNATLKNIRIGSGSVIKGKGGVGGIVGYAKTTTIQNSYNSAAVTGTANYVGGIAGYTDTKSTITQSSNTGAVTGVGYVGGIAGYAISTTTTNCKNSGTVTGTGKEVGGIAGEARLTTIENSQNSGAITGTSAVGGIAGIMDKSTITQSSNAGNVKGAGEVGGIAGSARGELKNTVIKNCQNSATVTGTGDGVGGIVGSANPITITQASNTGNVMGVRNIGGIAGSAAASSTITQSSNTGAVTATNNDVGGVVGNLNDAIVTLSFNTGRVEGNYNVGGVVGYVRGDANNTGTHTIAQVYNTGSVNGSGNNQDRFGGLIGAISPSIRNLTVANSYNIGEVRSAGSEVGGLLGTSLNDSITIINCFNTAHVSGTTKVGGSIGVYTNGRTPTNVLFKNTVVVTGTPDANTTPYNVKYTNISGFVNATGANRKYWDDKGRLLNPDGTLMAGPNPGGA